MNPPDHRRTPRVSVVSRTKDRPAMLARAARSVSGQALADLEWLVVNDAGDPGPVDLVVAGGPAELRARALHRTSSTGMESASNHGLREAVGEFVAIHDDDDTWDPRFLERTVGFLDANPRFHGVATHSVMIEETVAADGTIAETRRRPWVPHLGENIRGAVCLADMARINQFPPIAFVYRREALDALAGYDEELPVLGDWDFNLRFLERFEIGVLAEPLAFYHHRVSASPGAYGNSVIAGMDRHLAFDAIVRNRMLRRDIEQGVSGLGHLLAMGRLEQDARARTAPALAFAERLRHRLRDARQALMPWKREHRGDGLA